MTDKTPDPISEAIEEKLDEFNITNEQAEVLREALHRIATLSYARGVEDSAELINKPGTWSLAEKVRSLLTPNKDTV